MGLGDHRPDAARPHPAPAARDQADPVDEGDAEAPAADQGDPGEVPDRPRDDAQGPGEVPGAQAEAAAGDDGALPAGGREPCGELPPAARAGAGLPRPVLDAQRQPGPDGRAVLLLHRGERRRPREDGECRGMAGLAPHRPDVGDDVLLAEADDGPQQGHDGRQPDGAAAEDPALRHAGLPRGDLLPVPARDPPLLGHDQPVADRPAGHHPPRGHEARRGRREACSAVRRPRCGAVGSGARRDVGEARRREGRPGNRQGNRQGRRQGRGDREGPGKFRPLGHHLRSREFF